jgi:diguanylate cyclase (GGDEF)-like protein
MAALTNIKDDIKQLQLVIRLRWICLFFAAAAGLVYSLAKPFDPGLLVGIALFVFTYNILFHFHASWLSRQTPAGIPQQIRMNLFLQFTLDILAGALAIYHSGGAGSALSAFYILLIPAAGLIVSRRDSFLLALLAVVVLAGIFILAPETGRMAAAALPPVAVTGNSGEQLVFVWAIQASFIGLGVFITGGLRTQLRQSHAVEQRARLQAETLRKIAAALSSTLELSQLLDLVLKHLRELVACDGASIFLLEGDIIRYSASRGAPDPLYPLEPGGKWMENRLMRTAAVERRPVFDWDAVEEPGTAGKMKIRSRALLPLMIRDDVRGFLTVHGIQPNMFDEKEVASVQALGGHVALALENARLYESTRQMALTDGLTGLYNRSSFYQELEREINRSRRYGRQLSLLICDLDHFKKYNDQYGHLAGDDLLRSLAKVLTSVVRKSDIVFRYGGEEFVLLLPETGLSAALELAERLRRCVESHVFMLPKNAMPTHITISIGAASYPDQAEDVESLVDKADKALFLAKRSRNAISALR